MQKNLIFFTLLAVGSWNSDILTATKFEAEDAKYSKCTIVSNSIYSGGKALKLTDDAAIITFDIDIEQKGKYKLFVAGDGIGGEKYAKCSVNGSSGEFRLDAYGEVEMGTF